MNPASKQAFYFLAAFTFSGFFHSSAHAGLDLQNQTEVHIGDLDLDRDGRITRKETAEYMFFYFDRDGNESLTKGEYHTNREIAVFPYEGTEITLIDLDNDGKDDGVSYDKDTFLQTAMVGDYDAADGTIDAYNFVDTYFLRLDTDESRAIELDEWQKTYEAHAVNKPNDAPAAANNDHYAQ